LEHLRNDSSTFSPIFALVSRNISSGTEGYSSFNNAFNKYKDSSLYYTAVYRVQSVVEYLVGRNNDGEVYIRMEKQT
jgi:hypothetical protein